MERNTKISASLLLAILAIALVASIPTAHAYSASVGYSLSKKGDNLVLKVSAKGQLPPTVSFVVSLSYSANGQFVLFYSSSSKVLSSSGVATETFYTPYHATKDYYLVQVYAYDGSNGNLLLGFVIDPKAGGSNGGAGL